MYFKIKIPGQQINSLALVWKSTEAEQTNLQLDYKLKAFYTIQDGTWAVYWRFEFCQAKLTGLYWKIQAYAFICLSGLYKSHLCSVVMSQHDCLRMECQWFCWVLWSRSDLKHLFIIGAKEWQSAWEKRSGKVGVFFEKKNILWI